MNGVDSGIYVSREPINRDFLTRNFGRVARFSSYRPVIEAFINAGGTNGAAGLP